MPDHHKATLFGAWGLCGDGGRRRVDTPPSPNFTRSCPPAAQACAQPVRLMRSAPASRVVCVEKYGLAVAYGPAGRIGRGILGYLEYFKKKKQTFGNQLAGRIPESSRACQEAMRSPPGTGPRDGRPRQRIVACDSGAQGVVGVLPPRGPARGAKTSPATYASQQMTVH